MQTEFTRYHYTSTEMAKHVKNWQYPTSTDEKVEKMEHSYIAGGTTKWFSLENNLEISQKVMHTFTIWPNNPTPRYLLKWNENLSLHKNLYACL